MTSRPMTAPRARDICATDPDRDYSKVFHFSSKQKHEVISIKKSQYIPIIAYI